jgi:hypothetical protein
VTVLIGSVHMRRQREIPSLHGERGWERKTLRRADPSKT